MSIQSLLIYLLIGMLTIPPIVFGIIAFQEKTNVSPLDPSPYAKFIFSTIGMINSFAIKLLAVIISQNPKYVFTPLGLDVAVKISPPRFIINGDPYTDYYAKEAKIEWMEKDLDEDVLNVLREEGYFNENPQSTDDLKRLFILYTNYMVAKLIKTTVIEVDNYYFGSTDMGRRMICFAYPDFEINNDVAIDEGLVSALLASFKDSSCPKYITNRIDPSKSKYSNLVSRILTTLKNKGKNPDACINGDDRVKFANSEDGKYVFKKPDEIIVVKKDEHIAKETAFFKKYFEPKYLCVFIGVDDPDVEIKMEGNTPIVRMGPSRIVVRGYFIIRLKNTDREKIMESLKDMLKEKYLSNYYLLPPHPTISFYDFERPIDSDPYLNKYLTPSTLRTFAVPEIRTAIREYVNENGISLEICDLVYGETFDKCENKLLVVKIRDIPSDIEISKLVKDYMEYLTEKYPELNSSILYYVLEESEIILIHPFAIFYSEDYPLIWVKENLGIENPSEVTHKCEYDYENKEYVCPKIIRYSTTCTLGSGEEVTCYKEKEDLGYLWDVDLTKDQPLPLYEIPWG